MADPTSSAPSSLPMPPAGVGYENGSAQATMPPPPQPSLGLSIPPSSGAVPQSLTDILSPTSAGGTVRRAAPEPNKRALYVGGLDPRVTEDVLKQIFETTGHVQNVKIIPDKNVSIPSRAFTDRCWPRAPQATHAFAHITRGWAGGMLVKLPGDHSTGYRQSLQHLIPPRLALDGTHC